MASFECWRESPRATATSAPDEVYEELIPAPLDQEHLHRLYAAVRGGIDEVELACALAVFEGDPFAHSEQARIFALALRNHALHQRLCDAIARGDGAAADRLLRAGADYAGSTDVLPVLDAGALTRLRELVDETMCEAIDRVLASSMD